MKNKILIACLLAGLAASLAVLGLVLWGKPGDDSDVYKAMALRQAKDFANCFKCRGETAVSRANALKAIEACLSGRYGANTPAHVVTANLERGGRLCDSALLAVSVFSGKATVAQLVLVFKYPDGSTGQIVQPIRVEHRLDIQPILMVRACEVDVSALAGMGSLDDDGTVHISAEAVSGKITGCGSKVPVPNVEVAVGLRLADGSYTNFVPLIRLAELSGAEQGK